MNLGATETQNEMLSFFRGVAVHEVLMFYSLVKKKITEAKRKTNHCILGYGSHSPLSVRTRKLPHGSETLFTKDFEEFYPSPLIRTIGKIL